MYTMARLSAANYHYKRYSLDYFFNSVERLGYETIELWASGPHLNLEDFTTDGLKAVKKNIAAGTDTIDDFVKTLGKDLNHVHFLDGNPGGHLVPGDGRLDMKHILNVFDEAGYEGYLALEILDRSYVMEPDKALEAAMDWYKVNAL
jgi:sugar phosphate isomerase/epimerase